MERKVQSGVVITKMLIQVTLRGATPFHAEIQEVESSTKYHFLAISGEDGFFRDIYSQSRLMTLLHGGQNGKNTHITFDQARCYASFAHRNERKKR